jgi:hypothetical protein
MPFPQRQSTSLKKRITLPPTLSGFFFIFIRNPLKLACSLLYNLGKRNKKEKERYPTKANRISVVHSHRPQPTLRRAPKARTHHHHSPSKHPFRADCVWRCYHISTSFSMDPVSSPVSNYCTHSIL